MSLISYLKVIQMMIASALFGVILMPGFVSVQSLQQKNMELLTVVRQLSDEKDHERALLEQDKAKDRETLEAEKNALYAEHAKQQVLSHAANIRRCLEFYANSLLCTSVAAPFRMPRSM